MTNHTELIARLLAAANLEANELAELLAEAADALEAAQPTPQVPMTPDYDKSALNARVQELYDAKMREGKHGHYETLFHCVHAAIRQIHAAAPEPTEEPKP